MEKSMGDTKMKITFLRDPSMVTNTTSGIRTTITSFTIQDIDGLIYKFTLHGLTQMLQPNYCDKDLVQSQTQPKFDAGSINHQSSFINPQFINPFVIGSWYLSEIDDPLTLRKIQFTYISKNINSSA